MRCAVVLSDGFFGSGVASVLDIFAAAEAARPDVDASIPPFDTEIVAPQKYVTSGSGMRLQASHGLDDLGAFELVLVPGLGTYSAEATQSALASRQCRRISRSLAQLPDETRVAAACTGVFQIADAGLADGHTVTTTWFLGPEFRRRYPAATLDLTSMVVADGRCITAGAAFAHVDLALSLVRDVSADLAERVARLLLIDERPSQTSYLAYDVIRHDNDLVNAFERHVRANLADPFDVASAAAAIGTSRRTLERSTRDLLGASPLGIVQRLRVERAAHLRRTSGLSLEQIAPRVGYQNAATLRALMRRDAAPARR